MLLRIKETGIAPCSYTATTFSLTIMGEFLRISERSPLEVPTVLQAALAFTCMEQQHADLKGLHQMFSRNLVSDDGDFRNCLSQWERLESANSSVIMKIQVQE